ncbi:MAG: UDP-N-acetylmuramoyl-L-alanine--D-glutamate ligase [Puniceicoccales bacterium]|nr:UDP-N-acetylmuramoyl-L-alanine--D-glutamate ligase [Puniceicoccales bacterium]
MNTALDCTLKKLLRERFLAAAKRSPVGIFGNGVTARGVRKLLEKLNLRSIIYDRDPRRGENFDGQALRRHHIIIGSPSFLSHHPWRKLLLAAKKWYWPELDFASLWHFGGVVAVTGTNGKTTTASFLAEIFNGDGRRAFTAGNIGRSLSDLVAAEDLGAGDTIFCETSSFQAETLNFFAPDYLIWTNFAPNHFDYHGTLRDYFAAKYRLVRRLAAVHGAGETRLFAGESVATWAHYFRLAMPQETHYLAPKKTLLAPFDDFPQRENYAIVEDFCRCRGIAPEVVAAAATHFRRPKYRLENMGAIGGNTYWNDSKCTNFAALEAALGHFSGRDVIWIGGGHFKGGNLEDIVSILRGRVERAVLIGETGAPLEAILRKQNFPAIYVKTLENAVRYIKNACFSEKNIVFSPAFSSFDQFSDYEERGKFFEKCIFSL